MTQFYLLAFQLIEDYLYTYKRGASKFICAFGQLNFTKFNEFSFTESPFNVSKFGMVYIENQPIRIIMIRTLVMIVRYNADYDQRTPTPFCNSLSRYFIIILFFILIFIFSNVDRLNSSNTSHDSSINLQLSKNTASVMKCFYL